VLDSKIRRRVKGLRTSEVEGWQSIDSSGKRHCIWWILYNFIWYTIYHRIIFYFEHGID
jgi:hypothetical protein